MRTVRSAPGGAQSKREGVHYGPLDVVGLVGGDGENDLVVEDGPQHWEQLGGQAEEALHHQVAGAALTH